MMTKPMKKLLAMAAGVGLLAAAPLPASAQTQVYCTNCATHLDSMVLEQWLEAVNTNVVNANWWLNYVQQDTAVIRGDTNAIRETATNIDTTLTTINTGLEDEADAWGNTYANVLQDGIKIMQETNGYRKTDMPYYDGAIPTCNGAMSPGILQGAGGASVHFFNAYGGYDDFELKELREAQDAVNFSDTTEITAGSGGSTGPAKPPATFYDRLCRQSTATMETFRKSLEILDANWALQSASSLSAEEEMLQLIREKSRTAKGVRDAVQASNLFLNKMVDELRTNRQLMLTQIQSQVAFAAYMVQRDVDQQAQIQVRKERSTGLSTEFEDLSSKAFR